METPDQGQQSRQYVTAYKLYKPRKNGGGFASSWAYSKDKGAVFLEMAPQIGTMNGEDNAKFDWKGARETMKLGVTDIGEILAVLERRQKGLGPQKDGGEHRGLYHKNAKGSTSLYLTSAENGGWHLKLGSQKTGQQAQSMSHSITFGEGTVLLVLLRTAIERMYAW